MRRTLSKALCVVAGLAASTPAHAQGTAQAGADSFYDARQMTLLVGFNPGGGYDIYGRLLAQHLPRRIAGAPSIVVRNMPGGGSLIADTVEGVKFVIGHQGIRAVMLLAFIISICIRPIIDLMPGFADAVYHRPTEGLATLMSAFGIGAMIGSVWLANRNRLTGTVNITILGNAAAAGFIIVFSAFGIYPLAIVAMFGLGIASALGFNGAQILIQNAAAGPMRSRVMGLYAYNFQGVPAVGAMTIGFASGFFGLQIPAVAAGTISLLATLWVWRSRKRIAAHMETGGESAPQKKAAE